MVPLALTEESHATPEESFLYHSKLSDDEMEIFEILKDPYEDGSKPTGDTWNDSVAVVPEGTESKVVESVAKLITLEDPGLYWLWAAPVLNEDLTLKFTPVYGFDTEDSLEEMNAFIEEIKSEQELEHELGDVVKIIDGKLREKVEFTDDDGTVAGTAFGAIVEGKANSFGFSAAFNYAIKEIYDGRLNVLTVVGKLHNSEGYTLHAWNVVSDADGTWYGVDITLNKVDNTDSYIMKASNDRGNSEGYTFAASHQSYPSEYLGLEILFDAPEPYKREILPPEPPTILEKYGSHVIVLIIVSILSILMIVHARKAS